MRNLQDLLAKHSGTTILFIFPHFDDCAYVSSGLLQAARRFDIKTFVVVLVEKDDEVGIVEFQKYALDLGTNETKVIKTKRSTMKLDIMAVINSVKPEFVVSFDPGGVTGNSHHTLTSLKTYEALKSLKKRPKLLWRVADVEEEKYFGKTPRPLGKEYDPIIKLNLDLKNSIRKVKAILSNKSKMRGFLYQLRVIEWYLLDHQENYYLVDFNRDRLKVSYN